MMTLTQIQKPIPFSVSRPQFEFIAAKEKYPAFCAGFGAGKTIAGVLRALVIKCQYPKLDVGYYMPTFDLVTTVAHPAFLEVLDRMGVHADIVKGGRELEVAGAGKVIFRSMDDPATIIGYKHTDAIADELDTLPRQKARAVWRKILGRNRQVKPDGALNTIAVTSTPEGFRFLYENWQKKPIPGTRLIRASTYSNRRNLPADYIPDLLANYPAQLVQAYLHGLFVNLTSGSVYHEFSRTLNATYETIQPNEPLHVGMDFNVGNMNAVIHVERNGDPYALDELTGVMDTFSMVSLLTTRFKEKGHQIIVYPDPSGSSRKSTHASESDIALLKQGGFRVSGFTKHPAIKDRVLAVSKMIHSQGERRYRINPDKCPMTVEDLEKQAYDDNGEPDKKSGHDHRPDALGYYVAYRWPIVRPATSINFGMAN